MPYKNQGFLLLLAFCTLSVRGQKLDSLLNELKNYKKEDTVKLKTLINIGMEYENSNPSLGVAISDSAIYLSIKINDKKNLMQAYNVKGLNLFLKGDYSSALLSYQKSLDIATEIKHKIGIANTYTNMATIEGMQSNHSRAIDLYSKALVIYRALNFKKGMSSPLINLGLIYRNLSDYKTSRKYLEEALAICTEIGDKQSLAACLIGIGVLYRNTNDDEKAIESFRKALGIYAQLNSKRGMATAVSKIAEAFRDMGETDSATYYFKKSLIMGEQVGDKGLIMLNLANLADFEFKNLKYRAALDDYTKALSISEQLGFKDGTSKLLIKLGDFYSAVPDSFLIAKGIDLSKRYASAIEYVNRGLKIGLENENLETQENAYESLNKIHVVMRDYNNALQNYKQYISIRDSILNDKKKTEFLVQDMEYEFGRKEDSTKLQRQETELRLKENQQQLLLNQKELAITNKEKDLQKLAYLKTQSDLQNEQLEKKGKERLLTISEKEKELQSSKVKTLLQDKNLNALKQQQQWFYIIGVVILLGFISFYFFYRARLQQVRLRTQIAAERIEQQQKEAEFQRQLGDVSLSALRSQMNPHFIFNCLNSIKLYTTQNDTAAASEYLTKFSKLIRLILENSRSERITLAAELNALRLYIQMEAMRFKEKLKYNIAVEKDVELDYIEMPPLLLQPYVENAIWHGLMQKEEGGRIDINVGIQNSESIVVINIVDNGIGRAKSAELRSKTATKHKSYGMKVTSERLALINQVYKTGANVTILDLTNNYGQALGTQVTIKIPIE